MDDALMVTNLVYFGTLVIGGALLMFLTVATVITLMIAGAGQGVASVSMAVLRAARGLVERVLARRAAAVEGPAAETEDARAEYARRAVIAKADALLAAKQASATAASASAAESRGPRAIDAEDAQPADEEVAIPALAPALAVAQAPAPIEDHPAPARPSEPAAVARMRPARPLPARPGPHTGTQPVLVVSRAS